MKIIISKNCMHVLAFLFILLVFLIPNPIKSKIEFANFTRMCGLFFISLSIVKKSKKQKGSFKWFVYFFCLLEIVEILISTYNYKENIIITLIIALGDFSILGYFWLVERGDYKTTLLVKNFLIRYTLFMAIYVIIQYWIYKYFGINLLISFANYSGRIGNIRVPFGGILMYYGTVIAYGEVFRSINQHGISWKIYKGDGIYFLSAIIGTYYLVFYNQTRGGLIALILVFVTMLIMSLKTNRLKMLGISVGLILAVIIPQLPIVKQYVSFSKTDTYSTDTRLEEIEFFMETGLQSPFLGKGIIYSENEQYGWLLNGYGKKFFRDDVGVFGHFQKYGIVGCIWLLALILKMWKVVRESKRTGELYEVRMAVFLYFIFSSVTLLLIDPNKMLYFILILTLFEQNHNYELKENISKGD